MRATSTSSISTELPGLRDVSGAPASHGGRGINEVLDVIARLSAAGIPSCAVGVRALRYYGAGRVTSEWDLCVPDDKHGEARLVLLGALDKFTDAQPPPPVPKSRRHTYPCLRLKGYDFYVVLVPSSNCFVDPSCANHVERSRHGVPYASLVQFARSLLVQQQWADIADLIDGMDLDVEWGLQNIDFDNLQEMAGIPNLERIWRQLASADAKEQRIEPLKKGRYLTRWRSTRFPEDPRTRDRPV